MERLVLRRYSQGDRLDIIENPIHFEIADRDLYGTGKLVGGKALLVANGRWERVA